VALCRYTRRIPLTALTAVKSLDSRGRGTVVEMSRGMPTSLSFSSLAAIPLAALLVSVTTVNAQSVDAGQKVYAAQKCSICHSIGGVGNKKGPLEDAAAKLSADEIRQWITDAPAMSAKAKADRKPAMKAYTLPKEELDGLVAYIKSLKK
jgi:mono/diheme cytochrome c family protein